MLFGVGFVVGAFSVGLAWLKLGPAELQALTTSLKASAQAPPVAKAEEPQKLAAVPRPQFQFYSLLPEREVMVSEDEVNRRAKASSSVPTSPRPAPGAPVTSPGAPVVAAGSPPAPAPAPAPATAEEVLMLQVAAFKARADAEGLKAQLALKGMQAGIESANIKGEAYHRVRLGPYRSIEQLQAARSRLKGSGYDSVVVRLK
jgi:cell division protein FtsN